MRIGLPGPMSAEELFMSVRRACLGVRMTFSKSTMASPGAAVRDGFAFLFSQGIPRRSRRVFAHSSSGCRNSCGSRRRLSVVKAAMAMAASIPEDDPPIATAASTTPETDSSFAAENPSRAINSILSRSALRSLGLRRWNSGAESSSSCRTPGYCRWW